jgi:DMSO/TMAO reductase YedYZ molybdopterin-dependent catalytic subunit
MIVTRILRRRTVDVIDRAVAVLEQRGGSRRDFLQLSATSLAAAFLAACNSSGPERAEPILKFATRKNEQVERWLFQHTSMDHVSAGALTAGGRFPSYFVSDAVPTWDAATKGEWKLEIAGMVRTPITLTLQALMAMPAVEQRVDHFCVEGWNAVAVFRGVPVSAIAKLAGALPQASVVDFQSFDDDYHESWDIESAVHPQTMIVYAKDGQLLSPAYGAPARVHSPVKLGYKNTKYLTRIEFMAGPNGGYWTDRGYEWYGGT